MKKVMMVAVAAAFITGVTQSAAKTCIWTGGGDGYRFGDTTNWDQAPVDGDALVLTNRTEALLNLTNDLGSVEVPFIAQKLTFTGAGAIHLVGNPLELKGGQNSTFACPVTNDVDFILTEVNGHTLNLGESKDMSNNTVTGYLVQNGDIRGTGDVGLILSYASYAAGSQNSVFNGDIIIPEGDVSGRGTNNGIEYIFRGRVICKNINYNSRGTWGAGYRGIMRFYNPGNNISNLYVTYKKFFTYTDNGFGTNVTVRRGMSTDEFAHLTLPNGSPTVIANFGQNDANPTATTSGNVFTTSTTGANDALATLIARGTENNTNDFILYNRLAFVWDPVDDYTVDFRSARSSPTTGPITVNRGIMRVSAAATFPNVPEIEIAENATFEMVGGSTSALTGLQFIKLASGATFRLGADEVTPFTAAKTVFRLRGTAKLDLSCDVTTSVAVFVDDVPVAAGTYAAEPDNGVTGVNWITGAGKLTVVDAPDYHWTGAVSTDWHTAGNWVNGVPEFSTAKTAYLIKRGTTTVNVTADAPTVKHLNMENENDKTTLNVGAAFAVSNGTLTVGRGTEIKVGADGEFKYDYKLYKNDISTPALTLRDGGTITVDGGCFLADNLKGLTTIGDGNVSVTSTLAIVSGSCDFNMADRRSFLLKKGGLIKMTGGTFQMYYTYAGGRLPDCFKMFGGAIDLSGDAVMTNAMNATTLFGDASIRIGGFSKFIINGQAYRCGLNPSTADGLLDFVVYDNGQFDASLEDATYLNNSALAGSVTRITASDSATVKFGHTAVVGYAAGSTGELILKDSVTCQNGLYGFTFGRGGSATDISTGILRMSGGTFTIGSSKTTTYPDLYGFVFGNGAATNATGEIWNKGFGYISGGTITVCQGIHIGDGNAYGFVEQSGGKIQMSNNNSYPVNVGNHHGTGVYRMTGGTFHTPNSTVSVGANNGNGMLEFGAGTGTCTAKNMNLAGVGATLKFVLGADGSVIKPNVTDTLTIDPGAKIVVDTTACAEPKSVDLMTFGAKSGSFADADIEIIGIKGALVSQSDAKLRLQINKGTVVIIR